MIGDRRRSCVYLKRRELSRRKAKAKGQPVVIQPPAPIALPGQGLKEKGPPIDSDIEPANEPGSSCETSGDAGSSGD